MHCSPNRPHVFLVFFPLTDLSPLRSFHELVAMDCNLHKIQTPIWYPDTPSRLLPAPRDAIELGERILAFWAVFILDQRCCVIMGLPSSFSKGDELDTRSRIDTVWVCMHFRVCAVRKS